ncbi:FHA domain-containing protein [Halobacteriovorax marinus]|uniref:FHA domain-containing protein n=1 Tax=Halobacteriovorax marinus TaxID=97084 RepID=UPI003A923460
MLLSKTKDYSRLKLTGHNLEFTLTKKKLLVGSSEKCDIQIKDSSISAYHAILIINQDGGAKIIDLESNNGTYINSERVDSGILYPGDNIQFANEIFNLDEVIDELQRNDTVIEDEDMDIHTIQELEDRHPTPVLPPVPGLVIIDGEYCDIKFDEENYSHANELNLVENIDPKSYVEVNETKEFLPIARKNDAKAVQITVLSMGVALSIDYFPLKNGDIRVSAHDRKKDTFQLPSFDSEENIPFLSISDSNIKIKEIDGHNCTSLLTNEEVSNNYSLKNDEIISYTKGTTQVLIKIADAPPHLRSTPFFGRDRDFQKQTAKVFSVVMSLMLLLLFIDIPTQEEEKKVAVIYRPAVKAPEKNNSKTSSEVSKTEVDTGVKKEKQNDKKPQFAKKQDTQKKPVPKQTPKPAQKQAKAAAKSQNVKSKRQMKSFKFKMNKSMASFFGSTGSKSAKVVKNSNSNANAIGSSAKSATTSDIKAANNNATSGLGQDFRGSFDTSSGSKGLASKSGIDTTYTDQKAVVLGSMDPELLRKILREYLPQFKHCYQQELEYRNEHAKGVMDLHFRINSAGKAQRVRIKTKGSQFSNKGTNCMTGVLKLIQFPKPKGGGVVDVKQPLNFLSEKSKI